MHPTLRHRLLNVAQSALLLGGMGLIAWACTAALAGPVTGIWALAGFALVMLLAPSAPKEAFLRFYGARRLHPAEFPLGAEILARLARRAELPRPPALWYVPSRAPNAFAVGGPDDSAIAVSDGMLRMLTRREFEGVLAHEVSHVAHRDLWIMGLADTISRATVFMSYAGQLLLILNLPLLLMGAVTIPWIVPILLVFAPSLVGLLQLALSRAREFDADLGAARLTGDPMALASALGKLERRAGRFWEEILLPGRRMPDPSLLRTHPKTEDRIARLRELAREADGRPGRNEDRGGHRIPVHVHPVSRAPRLRWTGVWY